MSDYSRTRVGKGGDFAARFNPRNYEKSGRPGMPGSGDVDTAARNADMAQAAATGAWMDSSNYYGNDPYSREAKYAQHIAKQKKKGEYEYKDNAKGALEKLYDNGMGDDSAIAFGSARGIKSINSLSDADAILDQFKMAQGSKKKKEKPKEPKEEKPEATPEITYSPEIQEAKERTQNYQKNNSALVFDGSGAQIHKQHDFSKKEFKAN